MRRGTETTDSCIHAQNSVPCSREHFHSGARQGPPKLFALPRHRTQSRAWMESLARVKTHTMYGVLACICASSLPRSGPHGVGLCSVAFLAMGSIQYSFCLAACSLFLSWLSPLFIREETKGREGSLAPGCLVLGKPCRPNQDGHVRDPGC